MRGVRTCGRAATGSAAALPAEAEALIAAHEAGARVCELARVYGVHRTTVAWHVARAGKTRQVLTEAQIDEAVHPYAVGWTLHGIGRSLGAADQTVRGSGATNEQSPHLTRVDGRRTWQPV